MASRYASAAALLVVVAVAAVFQATSAAYIVPEGKLFPENVWRFWVINY